MRPVPVVFLLMAFTLQLSAKYSVGDKSQRERPIIQNCCKTLPNAPDCLATMLSSVYVLQHAPYSSGPSSSLSQVMKVKFELLPHKIRSCVARVTSIHEFDISP